MKKLTALMTAAVLLAGNALAVDPEVGNARGYGDCSHQEASEQMHAIDALHNG